MKTLFLSLGLLTAVMASAQSGPKTEKTKKTRQYMAPNGLMQVSIVPVGKVPARAKYESRVEFLSVDRTLVCALDFSSEDSEHGFGVVKAEWTPDSQYFVFSLTSSGGHQSWHSPTQFYSRKDGTVRSLNDYFEAGISESDFRIIAPNTVKTKVWEDKAVPVSVMLDKPPRARYGGGNKPFTIRCMEGAEVKVEDP